MGYGIVVDLPSGKHGRAVEESRCLTDPQKRTTLAHMGSSHDMSWMCIFTIDWWLVLIPSDSLQSPKSFDATSLQIILFISY